MTDSYMEWWEEEEYDILEQLEEEIEEPEWPEPREPEEPYFEPGEEKESDIERLLFNGGDKSARYVVYYE